MRASRKPWVTPILALAVACLSCSSQANSDFACTPGQSIQCSGTNGCVGAQENVVNAQPTQQWLIGQISDSSCSNGTADGWYIDPADPGGQTMVLCPTTCTTVQRDKNAVLNVRQGCKSIVPPPT
jgi:hypothetical protein